MRPSSTRCAPRLPCSSVETVSNDIHDSVYDAIEVRIDALRSGAPASGAETGARTQDDVDAELGKLEADKAHLLDHWKTHDGVVGATPPSAVRARACGQAQPCPHVLGLAQTYGVV